MKTLITFLLVSLLNASASSWVDSYDSLLKKYVNSDGVEYRSLKKNSETLTAITSAIATEKPSGSKEDQLAFYLNAYNAWMLKKAVDVYPTDSVFNNDKNVYKRDDIQVAGKTMSLDYLENSIIRKKFNDARIHFALNCASEGCPPLHKRAFKGSSLNNDLHNLTSKFINSKNGVQVKGSALHVNKIFEWFAVDFKKDAGSVINYIKKYRDVKGASSLSYLPYSWALND